MRDPRAAWRSRNLSRDDIDLIRHHLSRGLSDASARALIWWLRNSFYFRGRLHERPDALLVRYELLVTGPRDSIRAIFNFVGIPFEERYVSQVFSSSVHRRPDPSIDPEIRALCDGLLERFEEALTGRTERPVAQQSAIHAL